MKRWLGLRIAAVAAVALVAAAGWAQEKPEAQAALAAQAWLALTDTGLYAQSWNEAAGSFRAHITQEQWVETAKKVRTPLGKVKARKIAQAKYTKDIPGAPAGEYVILQYSTSFEKLSSATETVVPVLDRDGTWRVSGYFIKP